MTRYTQTAINRKFMSVVVKDAKGRVIDRKMIRRDRPIPAEARHIEFIKFKGQKYSVLVSPGQWINHGRELQRQGIISKFYRRNGKKT